MQTAGREGRPLPDFGRGLSLRRPQGAPSLVADARSIHAFSAAEMGETATLRPSDTVAGARCAALRLALSARAVDADATTSTAARAICTLLNISVSSC